MSKIDNILMEIQQEIQQEMRRAAVGVDRDILQKNIILEKDLVVAIQGVRRCGKSTLLSVFGALKLRVLAL
jgi:predicted AAA+ superfamily ATPase